MCGLLLPARVESRQTSTKNQQEIGNGEKGRREKRQRGSPQESIKRNPEELHQVPILTRLLQAPESSGRHPGRRRLGRKLEPPSSEVSSNVAALHSHLHFTPASIRKKPKMSRRILEEQNTDARRMQMRDERGEGRGPDNGRGDRAAGIKDEQRAAKPRQRETDRQTGSKY